jgi:hypothetical protein
LRATGIQFDINGYQVPVDVVLYDFSGERVLTKIGIDFSCDYRKNAADALFAHLEQIHFSTISHYVVLHYVVPYCAKNEKPEDDPPSNFCMVFSSFPKRLHMTDDQTTHVTARHLVFC